MVGRPRTRVPPDVYPNGRLVGGLRREASGAIDFRYPPAWLDWKFAFPIPLSLPFRKDRYIGAAVVAVLDNLLPDNSETTRLRPVQTRAKGTDPFSLPGAVRCDLAAALDLVFAGSEPSFVGKVDGGTLTDAGIAAMLRETRHFPLADATKTAFRISLAGEQEKTDL